MRCYLTGSISECHHIHTYIHTYNWPVESVSILDRDTPRPWLNTDKKDKKVTKMDEKRTCCCPWQFAQICPSAIESFTDWKRNWPSKWWVSMIVANQCATFANRILQQHAWIEGCSMSSGCWRSPIWSGALLTCSMAYILQACMHHDAGAHLSISLLASLLGCLTSK